VGVNPYGYAPDGEFGPHPYGGPVGSEGYSTGNGFRPYGLALGRRRACLPSKSFWVSANVKALAVPPRIE